MFASPGRTLQECMSLCMKYMISNLCLMKFTKSSKEMLELGLGPIRLAHVSFNPHLQFALS